jgi:hypothetical protein
LDIESDVEVRRKMFRQKQLKKLCWAGTLALFGFIMIIVGLNWYSINRKGYSAFLLVGCIMFIPGAYGVYEVVGTLNGWSGFDQLNDGDERDEDSWTYTL